MAETRLFSNAARVYVSASLGISTTAQLFSMRPYTIRKASRSSRLMRFLFTLFPCFLLTHTPKDVLRAGMYSRIKAGEKHFFPLVNNFLNSVFFLILQYKTHLFPPNYYAEIFFLPLSLRRLSVLRPPCVFILWRNPCTLLLCLFLGW